MFATLPSEMAGVGYYGEQIRNALGDDRVKRGEPKISYQQLARMLEARGKLDPKTQKPIDKSRIAQYATDRIMAPRWFLRALGEILGLEPDWWGPDPDHVDRAQPVGRADENVKVATVRTHIAPALTDGGLKETYLPNRNTWTVSGHVPSFIESDNVILLPIGDSIESMPHFKPGHTLLVQILPKVVLKLDYIFAITLPDGSGEIRKAVWDPDKEQLVLRAPKARRPDIVFATHGPSDTPPCYIDGLVVGNMPDYDPEETERFNIVFNSWGLQIEDW